MPNTFEEEFKKYFPDIYRLHVLSQPIENGGGGETNMWTLVEALTAMNDQRITGTLTIEYNIGRINHINKKEMLLANKKR
jgi:hypothetical protein